MSYSRTTAHDAGEAHPAAPLSQVKNSTTERPKKTPFIADLFYVFPFTIRTPQFYILLKTRKECDESLPVGYPGQFDLILYVPSTIFQLNRNGSSWVERALS